jgi:uncharacterized protein (UPF0262 family)
MAQQGAETAVITFSLATHTLEICPLQRLIKDMFVYAEHPGARPVV